jgi:hypothetical protein
MITTSTYLVFCLVAVSLYCIVAIGELGNRSEEPEPSEESEDEAEEGWKPKVREFFSPKV